MPNRNIPLEVAVTGALDAIIIIDGDGNIISFNPAAEKIFGYDKKWHCQSKFVYFAKTSEPDFAAIDYPAFFRVDLSGSMAAPSI